MVKEKPSLFGGKQARFGGAGARPISDVDNKSRMRCASCMNNCYLFALLFLFSNCFSSEIAAGVWASAKGKKITKYLKWICFQSERWWKWISLVIADNASKDYEGLFVQMESIFTVFEEG